NVYSQGLNEGIAKCQGEYVVFFNNDIKVDPEYLRELIKVLEVDKSIGLASSVPPIPRGKAMVVSSLVDEDIRVSSFSRDSW
ncbi:unnamed protein product, partial [marine sediment metagenome]